MNHIAADKSTPAADPGALPKAYEPQAVEEKRYKFWLAQGCFIANPARVNSQRPAYSIVIPPPNVTGVLHMGHVLNNTIQDILARKARMDGKEVLWLPGTDHAGIATQAVVEKTLRKQGVIKHRDDIGRDKFLEHVWAWKEKHGGIIINQLKRLGCSCDWTRERFTMDPAYSRCVQRVFVELYRKGLIYRGRRIVNWDPAARTALSDEEVDMIETKGHLWYLKYPLLDDRGQPKANEYLAVATTRPETMLGDEAVAVNPKDNRYTKLVGRKALLPLQNKPIPIVADDFVDPKFGTGCVKVTPAHDPNDYQMALRHGLPVTVVIGPDGKMTREAGEDFDGLDRMEAREAVVEELTEQGLLLKTDDYIHNLGYSQRSHVPVEPYLSEQWFLKYPSVNQAIACVELGRLADKSVSVVRFTGAELSGTDRAELRESALSLAREQGWIGKSFPNEDTGWQILVRRKSLSHAFNNRNAVVIRAVAALPELIRTAVLWRSEPHQPPHPRFKRVHHFLGALELAEELYCVPIMVKELADGRMLYDYKAIRAAPGGKPLVAHLPKEKLGIQPAPNVAVVNVADLLAGVNFPMTGVICFHPERWAKTYAHWMTNLRDWCISRQLWWGHRIPVWRRKYLKTDLRRSPRLAEAFWPVDRISSLVENAQRPSTASAGEPKLSEKQTPGRPEARYEWHVVAEDSDSIEIEAVTDSDAAAEYLVSQGFTQDPDVLDTWFSSWLWPFATMGWPEKTDTLARFYPTSDLVTGPDILFFWVARMIMAGYEFMGQPPFRNVYFTGIIRDKLGRKMSKSLGNSPDPLELIAKFGADALRFGTMRSAPLGQDVLFDEKDVELGRNFCNKLYNACRFRLMHGKTTAQIANETLSEIQPALLVNDDHWILSRLDQAIREIDAAFAQYRFSEVTSTLYRFFWNEFCDWYVEATKAALYGPDTARKNNTLAVIDSVLSRALRLLHPFLPFVTEELWHGLECNLRFPTDAGRETIMTAPWPKPFSQAEKKRLGLDAAAAQTADAKYELVGKGRNLRREFNIPPSKKLKFALKPAGTPAQSDVEVLRVLLNAESVDVDPGFAPPKGTPMASNSFGELYLPLAGAIDIAAEKARLRKELAKAQAEIARIQSKINQPLFAQKVPPHVLEEHRRRLADWRARETQINNALIGLPG